VQPFVKLAADHNVAVVLIHHLNQQSDPHDPFDAFTGSTGLTAAAEGIMLLTRKRGDADAFLLADGKDIEEAQDLALGWDAATCVWTIQGDAATYRMHKERREIIELLEREDEPTGPKYVADALDRDHAAVRQMMKRMADDGQLQTAGYGKYVVSKGSGYTNSKGGSHSSHSSHTSTYGSGVTGVTGVTDPYTELLEAPTEWLRDQIGLCRKDVARLAPATARTIATVANDGAKPTEGEVQAALDALLDHIDDGGRNG
jgi:hypothetical protein